MATSSLGNLQAWDPISILTTAESAAILVPQNACELTVNTNQSLQMRIAAGGNAFCSIAPYTAESSAPIDVSSLWGKNIYLYNPTGSTATVNVGFRLRRAI